tara:strand:- start:685 stop:1431 length:747 start_codon:yes stop_codon:yes gene_type:complete
MNEEIKLEICLNSVASAVAAQRGGADRVELCDNLFEGGTTPSSGMVQVVRERIDIGLQVIIRPRGGDFVYSDDEYAVMEADIRRAKELGADGVVFGILRPDGSVDADRNGCLRELAYPLSATFHRAFDVTPDSHAALDHIVDLGFDRILTSGQSPTVWEGVCLIRELVEIAANRIIIMPGGDLRDDTLRRCREETGAREFHMLVDEELPSAANFHRDVPMGGALRPPETVLHVTDSARVRKGKESLAK